jgi:hypothetical protein
LILDFTLVNGATTMQEAYQIVDRASKHSSRELARWLAKEG